MKVINSKLAAIGLAAFVFASCSDSTDTPNSGNGESVVDNTTIGLQNESVTGLAVNYKNSTANARKLLGSRAAGENVTFKETFDVPKLDKATATNLIGVKDLTGGEYYLKAGEWDFRGKTIKDTKLFICGDAKVLYDKTQGGNTFVIQQGGSMTYYGNGNMVEANDEVYNDLGYFKTDDASKNIVIAGKLYANWRGTSEESGKKLMSGLGQTTNKVNPTQNITFKKGAVASIIGSIRANDLVIEEGANVYSTSNILNATNITVNGALKFEGFLETADLNVAGYIKEGNQAAIKVDHALTMEANSQIDARYINVTCQEKNNNKKGTELGAAEMKLNGNCEINLTDRGVINVNKLITDNTANQIKLNTANALAVIKADEFHNNGDAYIQALATPATNASYLLQFTKCFRGATQLPSSDDLDLSASYLDYDRATTGKVVVANDYKNQDYGYSLSSAINPDNLIANPKLDLFSATGVEETNISATSIQYNGGYLYVTYHTQGNGKDHFMGGMEVAHINGNELILDQKVKATSGMDVNHGMIADNRFYVAATTKQEGALLGYVPLSGGLMQENVAMTTFPFDKTNPENGIDGNCVVKFKNNYFVATNKGYQKFNSDFTERTPYPTTVDVKHLATAGDNTMYSLEATGTGAGTIKTFDNIDLVATNSNATTGNVGVVDGKNTIAFDGTNLYVCQGNGGLVRYDANGANGTVIFDAPVGNENGNVIGRVNGVAVDNNYVYVACGGYGLVVLDKAKAKGENVVARRRAFYDGKESINSANYVTLTPEGYICVAYGKSRVQIFKLTSTK